MAKSLLSCLWFHKACMKQCKNEYLNCNLQILLTFLLFPTSNSHSASYMENSNAVSMAVDGITQPAVGSKTTRKPVPLMRLSWDIFLYKPSLKSKGIYHTQNY